MKPVTGNEANGKDNTILMSTYLAFFDNPFFKSSLIFNVPGVNIKLSQHENMATHWDYKFLLWLHSCHELPLLSEAVSLAANLMPALHGARSPSTASPENLSDQAG